MDSKVHGPVGVICSINMCVRVYDTFGVRMENPKAARRQAEQIKVSKRSASGEGYCNGRALLRTAVFPGEFLLRLLVQLFLNLMWYL